MHRIDTPTAQVDKFGAGKNGFTRGNPQTGVPATALDDDYFDAVQEELAGVVEAAGVALDKTNKAQLLTALKKLFLRTDNNLSEIASAGPAAVAQTRANLGLDDAANMADVRKLIDAVFPIGVPLPYPLAAVPETSMGVVFFKMNGGTFSTSAYPKLALKYPTGVLPDMRGEFMRGWDDGRGADNGRALVSSQPATWIQPNIESTPRGANIMLGNVENEANAGATGAASGLTAAGNAGSRAHWDIRPRNIAFNYIVRAA